MKPNLLNNVLSALASLADFFLLLLLVNKYGVLSPIYVIFILFTLVNLFIEVRFLWKVAPLYHMLLELQAELNRLKEEKNDPYF